MLTIKSDTKPLRGLCGEISPHKLKRSVLLFTVSTLELVFITENAEWARDFFAGQGKFSQEYFVYFKKI